MDSIGDWLYVIILIIAGISSLFGSLGKKKRPEEQSIPRDIFRDIIIPQEEKHQPTPKPVVIQPQTAIEKRVSKTDNKYNKTEYQSLEMGEAYSSIMPRSIEQSPLIMDEECQIFTADHLPTDVDEWRKAIIYSEIYKRQY